MRPLWQRCLLPATWPARIVLAIVLLGLALTAMAAWFGGRWWINARTLAWVESTGGEVDWADPAPDDPSADWLRHPAFATIEVITVGGDRPLAPAELGRLRWHPRLRKLKLWVAAIGDEHLARLPSLPRLEWLSLDRSSISDAGLAALAHRPSLTYLDLSDTRITDAGMVHLSGLTRLQRLSLDGTAVGDVGLRALRRLTDLEVLSIGKLVTDLGIKEIVRHQKLTHLAFYGSPITDVGLERLTRDLPGLKEIDLQETKVSLLMVGVLKSIGIRVDYAARDARGR